METESGNLSNLSVEELDQLDRKIVSELREELKIESNLRDALEREIVDIVPFPIIVKKTDLDPDRALRVALSPNDQIEIKAQKTEKGVAWFVRNKTIAEKPKRPEPPGRVRLGSIEDAEKFVSEIDSTKIDIDQIKNLVHYLKNPSSKFEETQLYVFETPQKDIGGLALIGKYANEQKSGKIVRLATDPKYAGQGIGSALIQNLKKKFDRLSVSPDPFGKTPESTLDRLLKFYAKNGFVGFHGVWNKNVKSLDDSNVANDWIEINESVHSIANDQHTLDPQIIAQTVLERIVDDSNLNSNLPKKTVEDLLKWKKAYFRQVFFKSQLTEIDKTRYNKKLRL